MKSPPALIKPQLLVWARKASGLDLSASAKRLGVKPETLGAWELGKGKPMSIAQLRRAAAVYRRPLAVFFLPEAPKDFQAMRDFRRVAGHPPPQSTQLRYEIRRAQERRLLALDLLESVHEAPPTFRTKASHHDNAEDVGAELRKLLGVSVQQQFKWGSNAYAPLRAWKDAIERLGVLVFETDGVSVSEARGFSIAEERLPVIVLNGKDSVPARSFTLGHELVHIATRDSGVCESAERTWSTQSEVETFCNRVAGAMLMPRAALLEQADAKVRTEVDLAALQRLARLFAVSQQAMLVRLSELSRVPANKARQTLERLQATVIPPDADDVSPRIPYFRRVLKWNGRAFSSMVLSAYRSDAITLSDVSNYLGLQLKHLPKLEFELFSRIGRE